MLLVLANYLSSLEPSFAVFQYHVTFNSGSLNRTTHCSACRSVGYSSLENRQIGQSMSLMVQNRISQNRVHRRWVVCLF